MTCPVCFESGQSLSSCLHNNLGAIIIKPVFTEVHVFQTWCLSKTPRQNNSLPVVACHISFAKLAAPPSLVSPSSQHSQSLFQQSHEWGDASVLVRLAQPEDRNAAIGINPPTRWPTAAGMASLEILSTSHFLEPAARKNMFQHCQIQELRKPLAFDCSEKCRDVHHSCKRATAQGEESMDSQEAIPVLCAPMGFMPRSSSTIHS